MASDKVVIGGEEYISSARAAHLVGYTKDYVGQLARAGKIRAQLIGRTWYVSEDSIRSHKLSVHYNLKKQKKHEKTSKNVVFSEKQHKNTQKNPSSNVAVNVLVDSDFRYEKGERIYYDESDEEDECITQQTQKKQDAGVSNQAQQLGAAPIRIRTTKQKPSRAPTRSIPTIRNVSIDGVLSGTSHQSDTGNHIPAQQPKRKVRKVSFGGIQPPPLHNRKHGDKEERYPHAVTLKKTTHQDYYNHVPHDTITSRSEKKSKLIPVVGALVIFILSVIVYILW